jgi:hypothetical protein
LSLSLLRKMKSSGSKGVTLKKLNTACSSLPLPRGARRGSGLVTAGVACLLRRVQEFLEGLGTDGMAQKARELGVGGAVPCCHPRRCAPTGVACDAMVQLDGFDVEAARRLRCLSSVPALTSKPRLDAALSEAVAQPLLRPGRSVAEANPRALGESVPSAEDQVVLLKGCFSEETQLRLQPSSSAERRKARNRLRL